MRLLRLSGSECLVAKGSQCQALYHHLGSYRGPWAAFVCMVGHFTDSAQKTEKLDFAILDIGGGTS